MDKNLTAVVNNVLMSNTKNSLSDLVLLTLEKTVDGLVRLEDFTTNTHIYAQGYERNLNKASLSKALKRLREKGLVDFITDQELVIKLTKEGKEEAVWRKLKTAEEDWDGTWRIVLFDIPEKRRVVREALRYYLKNLGFKPWQQSVWVSKRNCSQYLKTYIKKMGISRWVKIIESVDVEF